MFSDRNPFMQSVKPLADLIRSSRKPVSADNPFLAIEQAVSSWITFCLHEFGELRDAMTEMTFLSTYGSPLLQAAVGLGTDTAATPRYIERELIRDATKARLRSELEHRFGVGSVEAAVLRALVYIRLPEGTIDERGFTVLKLLRSSRPVAKRMSLAQFKETLKEQFLLVCLDEDRAMTTLPRLLGDDVGMRKTALDALRQVLAARGEMSDMTKQRLAKVEALFDVKPEKTRRLVADHA
jgi:hypothetical protein